MAVVILVVSVVVVVKTDALSACGIRVSVLLVILYLYGRMRPRADVFHIYQGRRPFFLMPMMISAFGEIKP